MDASGNVYVAGYTTGADDRNTILLKYSSSSSQSWVQVYDAAEGDDEYADLALTSSGEPFVGGYVTQQGNKDFFAALYNTSGSVRWSESYNGMYNKNDAIQQVTSDGSGNFLVAGPSGQSGGTQTIMTIKYALHTLVKPQNEEVNAPFVENRGQTLDTDDDPVDNIRYYTRSMYPNVYIFGDKVSYVFAHIDTVPASQDTMARLDLSFVATSAQVTNGRTQVAVGLEQQEAFHNYYLGHIPEGRERVPLEDKVLQPSIYDNIDALYGQGQDGLFIRFICKPGSSPSDIKLTFTGATSLSVQGNGSLKVETALEDLVLPRPTAMTVGAEGTETAITAWQPSYSINSGVVSITTSSYDNTKTLVIKTGREREEDDNECDYYWSTYFGENKADFSLASDIDLQGRMYFTGKTTSSNFPTTTGAFQEQLHGKCDAFASSFFPPDIRNWITYYGGINEVSSELHETGLDISTNEENSLYFVGATNATDFPLHNSGGYYNDMFNMSAEGTRGYIVQLRQNDGVRQWATFFGDPATDEDLVNSVEVLSGGKFIVAGFANLPSNTTSLFPFKVLSGAHQESIGDSYLAEFTASNNQLWATKLLGTTPPSDNFVTDISENPADESLIITGEITTSNYDYIPHGDNSQPHGGGLIDGFVMRFDKERALAWSTYLGGSGGDWGNTVNCLPNGDFYVTGCTGSTNFPTKTIGDAADPLVNDVTHNGALDVFVTRFAYSDNEITWSRFLGGSNDDVLGQPASGGDLPSFLIRGVGIGDASTVDDANLYIVGQASSGFPVSSPTNGMDVNYYHSTIQGTTDGFLTVISNSDQKIGFSTFWGGGADDMAFSVSASKNQPLNYIAFTGGTTSMNPKIPLCSESNNPYYKTSYLGGTTDGFISKLYTTAVPTQAEFVGINVEMKIIPNPSSGIFNISCPFLHNDIIVEVFSSTGTLLHNQFFYDDFLNDYLPLDLSDYQPGVYFLKLTSEVEGISLITRILKF